MSKKKLHPLIVWNPRSYICSEWRGRRIKEKICCFVSDLFMLRDIRQTPEGEEE